MRPFGSYGTSATSERPPSFRCDESPVARLPRAGKTVLPGGPAEKIDLGSSRGARAGGRERRGDPGARHASSCASPARQWPRKPSTVGDRSTETVATVSRAVLCECGSGATVQPA